MELGKALRWRRFCAPEGHALIVPIDHGLTLGPLPGIENIGAMARWISDPAITGIVAHKGIIERLAARDVLGRAGVMMHLNGMSSLAPTPDRKEMLTDVETAIRLGADAVSVQINFDGANDSHNLTLLGHAVDVAQRFGLPILTMLYDKVPCVDQATRHRRLRQWMRAAIELGTDAIKIGAPTHIEEVAPILQELSDDVAILFAGGDITSDDEIVAIARAARQAGAAGMCVGRNVFSRTSPGEILARLSRALVADPVRELRRSAMGSR